jgi:hypothetical protein
MNNANQIVGYYGFDGAQHAFLATIDSLCSFALSPAGQHFPAAGGFASFTVSTAPTCNWITPRSTDWITILPSGSKGTAKVNYAVAANSGAARTATFVVGGQVYNIDQEALTCTFSIGPAVAAFDGTGGSARVVVTAPTGCPWTATSNAGWMSIGSGASGTGTGAVVINAAANSDGSRSGTVTIAGQTFSATQQSAASASACGAVDVTPQMSVSKGGLQFVPPAGSNLYSQVVTLRNSSAAVIHGPVYLVLLGEPTRDARGSNYNTGLVNQPALTTCFSAGDYLQPIWSGDIQPGQQIPGTLTWIRGVFAPSPSYLIKVLSGTPSR